MGQSDEGQKKVNLSQAEYEKRLKLQKMSVFPPYRISQLHCLQNVFQTLKKQEDNKLQLTALKQIEWLSNHPFINRILKLFKEQMQKLNSSKLDLQLFLVLLSGFHMSTQMEVKKHFLFTIMDVNRDGRITAKDLAEIIRDIHSGWEAMTNEESLRMATEALSRLHKQSLKKQDFLSLVSQDEIQEVLTARFDEHFV